MSVSDWRKLLERGKNFHGDTSTFQELADPKTDFCENLHELNESMKVDLKNLNRNELLKSVFERIYDFIIMYEKLDFFTRLDNDSYCINVFNECLFFSLCSYINTSSRIKRMSIDQFLNKNSPIEYSKKNNHDKINYRMTEASAFRKHRHRIVSKRFGYNNKNPNINKLQWSAIPKNAEHETSFIYNLKEYALIKPTIPNDAKLADVYKRIGNLYNDIYEAYELPIDENYQKNWVEAVNKFLSKLSKIEYTDFIELNKYYLSEINKNKQYYGLNLYRLEQHSRLYWFVMNVNNLMDYKTNTELEKILITSGIQKDILFPKLLKKLSGVDNYNYMESYVQEFKLLKNLVLVTSNLIIDEMVENVMLGSDWENFLVEKINEMTEQVLYNSDAVISMANHKSTEAQTNFELLLSFPIINEYEKLFFGETNTLTYLNGV